MQLTNSRNSPDLDDRGKAALFQSKRASLDLGGYPMSDKFISDIDYMLSKCNNVQSSVKQTKQLWGRSNSHRKSLAIKTPNNSNKQTGMIRKSRTLKQVASKNLLISPQKLTFEDMNSEQALNFIVNNKRDFGKRNSEKISQQDEELDRKKKAFIEKVSFNPMFRLPSEFFNDDYIKNFDYQEFKNVIESNRNNKDVKNMKHKHIRTEKKHRSDK